MIEIPAEKVPPIAKEIADSRTTRAILFWFGTVLAGLVGFGMKDDDGDTSGKLVGFAFWVIVLFSIGLKHYKLARRAGQAAKRSTDRSATFQLAGRELLAFSPEGVPMPEASVKLSERQATMLTALPTAQLRS
jgi:hypothetical protein